MVLQLLFNFSINWALSKQQVISEVQIGTAAVHKWKVLSWMSH